MDALCEAPEGLSSLHSYSSCMHGPAADAHAMTGLLLCTAAAAGHLLQHSAVQQTLTTLPSKPSSSHSLQAAW